MNRLPVLLLAALVLAAPAAAREEDPRQEFLKDVGRALKKGDAGAIAGHFPSEGKIELRLRGVTPGRYRDEQARSLLYTWLGSIQPQEVKLKEVRSAVGCFRTKYRVRADGTTVKGTIRVYFSQEGESWRITGIVES